MRLADIRTRAEEFLGESRKEWYEVGAGLKEDVRLSEIFAEYADLFTRDNIETLTSLADSADDEDESLRLAELRGFLTLAHIRNETRDLSEKALLFEAKTTVETPEGESIPYRQSAVALLNESNRERRTFLENARCEALAEKNVFLEQIHRATHGMADDLEFEGYLGMMAALKRYELEPVRDEMQRFLECTGALYAEAMEEALSRMGVPLSSAQRHDAQFCFRGSEYDALFPAEKIEPSAREVCASMGLDLSAEGRVRLDIEDRPLKSPRAFCASIRVPEEVYLVIRPRGGYDDYSAFWHELGHALHFAGVAADAPFEWKRLGDNSVTEGFAMLFDHLLLEPLWLVDALGGEASDYAAFLAHHALFELYMLRRYAAKIDYELTLHQGADLTGKDDAYREKLSSATGVEYPRISYLDDVDPFFYCANYLRAWMLQAQMAEVLKTKFGERWWANRESGGFLMEIWRDGQRHDGDSLSRHLGYQQLTTEPLEAQIRNLMPR